mmetsp:Transcript_36995/g.104438  ORF Transcript_36995/g.104438 Transcript_36995/m.104438 type:complete len:208 (-) Transcript_36995:1436-2059(-)
MRSLLVGVVHAEREPGAVTGAGDSHPRLRARSERSRLPVGPSACAGFPSLWFAGGFRSFGRGLGRRCGSILAKASLAKTGWCPFLEPGGGVLLREPGGLRDGGCCGRWRCCLPTPPVCCSAFSPAGPCDVGSSAAEWPSSSPVTEGFSCAGSTCKHSTWSEPSSSLEGTSTSGALLSAPQALVDSMAPFWSCDLSRSTDMLPPPSAS